MDKFLEKLNAVKEKASANPRPERWENRRKRWNSLQDRVEHLRTRMVNPEAIKSALPDELPPGMRWRNYHEGDDVSEYP